MKQQTNSKNTQLLLLLPEEWISELDTLARSRYVTRLALIRRYLRIAMDKELADLPALFEQRNVQKRTCERLQEYLDDRDYWND